MGGGSRTLERIAVVEDDAALRSAIARAVRSWGVLVTEAGTAEEAKALLATLPPPDLLLIDVRLSDHTAFDVLDAADRSAAAPIVVAMSGKASADEAFRLGQRGVRAYLAKPISLDALESAVRTAWGQAPDLEPLIAATVGRVGMRELQHQVRHVMLRQALALSRGSLRASARLLQVSRQAIQQMRHGSRTDQGTDPGGAPLPPRGSRPSAPLDAPATPPGRERPG